VAAYYAAVGLTMETLIGDARVLQGRHLVAHSLALRSPWWLRPVIEPFAGIIPRRLHQLESCRFGQLRHGISAIGIVCHDLTHDCPRYLATGADAGVSLYDAVATSASIPSMFPARSIEYEGQMCEFTDGGLSDPLPVGFARGAVLGATHVIASDCRSRCGTEAHPEAADLAYVRPRLEDTGVLRAPHASLLTAVAAGEAAVTPETIDRIKGW